MNLSEVFGEALHPQAQDEALRVLANLVEWALGNRGSRDGNPYMQPPVQEAMKYLAKATGVKDHYDVDLKALSQGMPSDGFREGDQVRGDFGKHGELIGVVSGDHVAYGLIPVTIYLDNGTHRTVYKNGKDLKKVG